MNATHVEYLSEKLKGCAEANARIEVLLELSTELAQQGDIDQARHFLGEVRALIERTGSTESSVRAIVLEGVLKYFENRSPDALDRLRRAQALATAFEFQDVRAEIGVWTAHFAFSFGDCALLREAITAGLDRYDSLPELLRCRLALVIADCYQYVGNWKDAGLWYAIARAIARRIRSRALMTAIEFNRLAVGISRARIERLLTLPASEGNHRSWLLEIDSVEALHELLGANSLPALIDFCRARLLALQGDYENAADLMRAIGARGEAGHCGLTEEVLLLEAQWLRITGNCDAGDWKCSGWKAFDLQGLDADDVVACLRMLEVVDASASSSLDFRMEMDRAVGGYDRQAKQILDALVPAKAAYPSASRIAALND